MSPSSGGHFHLKHFYSSVLSIKFNFQILGRSDQWLQSHCNFKLVIFFILNSLFLLRFTSIGGRLHINFFIFWFETFLKFGLKFGEDLTSAF